MKVYIFLLGFCAVLISSLGAGFSVHGLASLFSGSFVAVAVMAGALEFGKLVIAAFLESNWKRIPVLIRTYLTGAVITLMCITSMGIFGFLSNSYQTSSLDINRIQIQMESMQKDYDRSNEELARMYKSVDEIPADQATKKLMMQKRYEPLIADFTKKANDSLNGLNSLKLEQLKSQSKVGPLIYVAKAFHTNIDQVVRWLITLFVLVFDPLAVCLVIATSTAIRLHAADKMGESMPKAKKKEDEPSVATEGLENVAA
ncbi:MAG: hypothetical protein JST16_09515 [Bdellovibrionales bacterium]|nr:hypothetical protein [Bdellovibrionales bacterium]